MTDGIYKLFFELPGLPKTTNGSHGNWRAAAAERRKWRKASTSRAYPYKPSSPLLKCRLTLTRCSTTKPDIDNLAISFKGVVDGLKDAMIIHDDTDKVVIERYYLHEKAPRNKGKICILIEEIK